MIDDLSTRRTWTRATDARARDRGRRPGVREMAAKLRARRSTAGSGCASRPGRITRRALRPRPHRSGALDADRELDRVHARRRKHHRDRAVAEGQAVLGVAKRARAPAAAGPACSSPPGRRTRTRARAGASACTSRRGSWRRTAARSASRPPGRRNRLLLHAAARRRRAFPRSIILEQVAAAAVAAEARPGASWRAAAGPSSCPAASERAPSASCSAARRTT